MNLPKFADKNEEYEYYHHVCPECFGDDFDDPQHPMSYSDSRRNPNKYKCKNCGWEGYQHQFLATNLENVK